MAYAPDPDKRPIPASLVIGFATFLLIVALFFFAPVIVRALM
jgi:hypothetical protein